MTTPANYLILGAIPPPQDPETIVGGTAYGLHYHQLTEPADPRAPFLIPCIAAGSTDVLPLSLWKAQKRKLTPCRRCFVTDPIAVVSAIIRLHNRLAPMGAHNWGPVALSADADGLAIVLGRLIGAYRELSSGQRALAYSCARFVLVW